MTEPAKRIQKDQIRIYIKRQTWVLFVLIVAVSIIDKVWLASDFTVAKSTALGALLSFANQAIFTIFVFWHTRSRARRHIVSQMYQGQIIKWLLTVVGFALIFIYIQPLSAFSVFVGYIVMKISHFITSLFIK